MHNPSVIQSIEYDFRVNRQFVIDNYSSIGSIELDLNRENLSIIGIDYICINFNNSLDSRIFTRNSYTTDPELFALINKWIIDNVPESII